ncbi:MAG TPA: zinc ribbon domain-containing protein [Vicinamibacteria bacterium]|jgi:hypothetical protein
MSFPLLLLVLAAQPATVFEEMTIDLWPEYDRPATLVMYRFRVSAGAASSPEIAVPLPRDIEEVHAVAWKDEKGSLFDADFTRRVEGEREFLVTRLGSRDGQLEFYRPIQIDGRRRSFRFEWPGGAEIQALSFQIQRPARASGFRVLPAPRRQWDGENGLRYALVELGPQSTSGRPSIEIEYEKETDALTAPASTSAPPAPKGESPPEPEEPFPVWLAAAFGVGGGALLFFLLHAALRNRGPEMPVEKPRRKGAKPIFCHECGTEGERTDSFCRKCGTRLLTQ